MLDNIILTLDLQVKCGNDTIPHIQRTENTNTDNIKEESPITNLLLEEWL